MDVRDTDFILHILKVLNEQNDIIEGRHASKKKAAAKTTNFGMRSDISRLAAINTVQIVFKNWLHDGGDDIVQKIKSLPHTDKGSRFIDIDLLIQFLIEPWHAVRSNWEDHARYLFTEHCSVHRVIAESTFANDDGVQACDTILAEVNKFSAVDCIRRFRQS
jgi:hypothetical protein